MSSAPIPELSAVQEAIQKARARQADGWESLQSLTDWEIYTDGSAPIKNPGGAIGFSSVFVLDKETAWEVYGGTPGRTSEPATSNNRAEIAGALTILEVIYQLTQQGESLPGRVMIVCDSQYVVNCAQGRWKKHKNKDLWRRFDQLMCVARGKKVKIDFRWTRAHVATKWNERADVLAKDGAFLAIGQDAPQSSDVGSCSPQEPSETKAAVKDSDCHYTLYLYSEMTGKTGAKGSYRLATPNRERTAVVELDDVITLDEAEYQVLLEGFHDLLKTLGDADRDSKDFRVAVDSSRDLMLKQIRGQYGVKSERLQPLHKQVLQTARKFAGVHWNKSDKKDMKEALKSW